MKKILSIVWPLIWQNKKKVIAGLLAAAAAFGYVIDPNLASDIAEGLKEAALALENNNVE